MKLITHYTETHKIMFEKYFMESIDLYSEFEVLFSTGTQHSEDGDYFSKGFNETTKDKINFLLDTLNKKVEEDEYVLFSDVDVVFLKPIKKFLLDFKSFDMVFQNGIGGLNTGFFLLKNNKIVRNLLLEVVNKCHLYDNDQLALNDIIKNYDIKINMFGNEILSVAHLIGPKVWSYEKFNVPENTLVFHACWCAGVNKKIELLDYVRNYKKS